MAHTEVSATYGIALGAQHTYQQAGQWWPGPAQAQQVSGWNELASKTIVDMKTIQDMFEAQKQAVYEKMLPTPKEMADMWAQTTKPRKILLADSVKAKLEKERDPRYRLIQRALREIKQIAKAFGDDWEVNEHTLGIMINRGSDAALISLDSILDDIYHGEAVQLFQALMNPKPVSERIKSDRLLVCEDVERNERAVFDHRDTVGTFPIAAMRQGSIHGNYRTLFR